MKKLILFIVVLLVAVSCGNSNEKMNYGDGTLIKSMEYDATTSRKSAITSQKLNLEQPQSNQNESTIERKLIKTGNVSFETNELDKTRKIIIDLVIQNNGYVASDNQYKSDDRISTTI